MSNLLNKLNSAGLIEKLDGNDERFNQIETAANKVSGLLTETPALLIRATLAGLNPDVPENDPAILLAAEALQEAWKSVRSVHIDPPVQLYRFILLDACDQAADELNAVILWNTAADTLPLVRLGGEEKIIREMLLQWAEKAETKSLLVPNISEVKRAPVTKKLPEFEIKVATQPQIDRENLKLLVSSTAGPQYRGTATPNPNPHWSNSASHWSWDFTDRMTELLANQLDNLSSKTTASQKSLAKQLKEHDGLLIDNVTSLLGSQRSWLQGVIKESQENQRAEQLRLNTLWWCEANYSTSYKRSYREISHYLAAVLMPCDLLAEIQTPSPASVTYALSETVNKLPKMGFDKQYKLIEILDHLGSERTTFTSIWQDRIVSPPEAGRLSLRDVVMAVLLGQSTDLSLMIERAGLDGEFSISLPQLSQAIFRQDQAVDLAEGN